VLLGRTAERSERGGFGFLDKDGRHLPCSGVVAMHRFGYYGPLADMAFVQNTKLQLVVKSCSITQYPPHTRSNHCSFAAPVFNKERASPFMTPCT